jgi:2-dehydropantoate 2-reductase
VILAVKSQDTIGVLSALQQCAPASLPIVCAQNGVENERSALRRFRDVYGMCVICPATHLVAGHVQANSAPVSGLLDLGRWPRGTDGLAEAIAGALGESTFESQARDDISRWKWAKLLMNLGNAVEAVCGHEEPASQLAALAYEEGVACLDAAGIDHATPEEDAQRRAGLLTVRPIEGRARGGGSTWQSLKRGARELETDYLTGEIVMLGRIHGVPTPVNELVQGLANTMAAERREPGSIAPAEVLGMLT